MNDFKVDGHVIRQGSSIALSQWVMHRDPRYFDRPAEFAPERRTAEFTQHLPKLAYFPFGGGARQCIGASLAMMEATLLLVLIVQHYRLMLSSDQPIELWPTLTLHPKQSIKMNFTRR